MSHVVDNKKFFDAMVAAGIFQEGDRVQRVVIDMHVGHVPVMHVRFLGDDRLLEVVETLAGIEIRDGAS